MQYISKLEMVYMGSSSARYFCGEPSESAGSSGYKCISYHHEYAGSPLNSLI